MTRKKMISIVVLGALSAAAAFGVVAYRTASAATPTQGIVAHIGIGRGLGAGYSNEDLATALGISVDELSTAYQEATQAALEQAVEEGLITQAQADQLSDRGFVFPFGRGWAGWLSENGIDFDTLLADSLGITVDQLSEAYSQAIEARIDQAVADGRISEDQADLMKGRYALFSNESFLSAMRSAFEAAVQQAAESGVITQAQADRILSSDTGMGFPGLRGFGGFGRHGHWGGLPGNQFPVAPSVTPSDDL